MSTDVVVGLVVEVHIHPGGDFIRLAMVDIGSSMVQIVFGGPDLVCAGDFVPVAPPGTRLPGRKKMRRAKFRGQISHGMLGSAAEFGWQPDGPDEVALLNPSGLHPGSRLDGARWPDLQAEMRPGHLELRERWAARLRTPNKVRG
ncbi:hypothetical protein [Umezawaea sp. Da 62-37]|uniref:hypothetical protein n=1 Tax=Umezawaea sp. Da 62-37 TaxID=3075927 RepID=UPI0028F6C315|nr:hypothetical protein [Umezawaea sp. Da 62-37]WNV83827.1 hypothetical protein RM788_37485 [Umezawaea sp. Da 62-37]